MNILLFSFISFAADAYDNWTYLEDVLCLYE